GYHSGTTGVAYYDQSTSTLSHYEHIQLPVNFHGTGDLFSSVTVGGMMRGLSTFDALKLAADYTAETIAYTLADPTHHTYGVQFEATIPSLLQKLQMALA
ncbi:MAG: bifunctional hydroxymethylpyrimidine kinase/phosphomethylpyrimidine kinase, partial [Clostridia bacterium]|nr:bifunctional hydroxymethylpyrimidine kinase/phosphomethylpyrimidine kinase [Clostridia bacterium]